MTPKEQQLADQILDLALEARNPNDIGNLVSTYIQLSCYTRCSPDATHVITLDPDGPVLTGTEAPAVPDEVKGATVGPAKTRKPRAPKPETAPEPAVQETEPVAEETTAAAEATEQEDGKTHAEKIVEAQTAFMAHFKDLSDDDAAQRAFRVNTTDLAKKHGGDRISQVPEGNMDSFLADLDALIAESQPV